MRRTITVHVGEQDRLAGHLHYNREGARESASFEYAAVWLQSPDRFAIDPASLRLVAGPQFHKRATTHDSLFHGAIADTEPDGWARKVILRDHAKRRAVGESVRGHVLGELDYLLAVDDFSRIGALRLCDESGVFQRAGERGRRRAPPLISLAQLLASSRAVEMDEETESDLDYLRGRGTSVGGLRPKCSILDDAGRLAIGKFPSVGDQRAVTKGEALALILARDAGIRAAEASLVDSDGVPVTLVRRFDRKGDLRIPYISAMTLLGVEEGDSQPHTYTEIVDALRVHGADLVNDLEELWRRIAFSILSTNLDDHLRNHGFLYHGAGRWCLSPAFDINPFPDRVRELKTWISEETGPAAMLDPLMATATYFQVKAKRAREILAEVEGAVSKWRVRGREIGMSAVELDQFAEAFEHEERRVARQLVAPASPS